MNKEIIKSKAIDALFTFLGSIVAFIFYIKNIQKIQNYLKNNGFTDNNIDLLSGLFFSTLTVVWFIILYLLALCMVKISERIWRPVVKVTFKDESGNRNYHIQFIGELPEPQYLRIVFTAKFSKLQLLLLKLIKAKVIIKTNPKMCSFELDYGFISQDTDITLYEQGIIYDLFKKYDSSTELNDIYLDVNLQIVSPGKGEIKVELHLFNMPKIFILLFGWYGKFSVDKIELNGG